MTSFEIFIRHEIHTTCNSYERPNSYELHVVRFSCSKVYIIKQQINGSISKQSSQPYIYIYIVLISHSEYKNLLK